jgi:hypothetical protein
LFLSHDEIAQLTGYVRSADQIKWLCRKAWVHEVNARGHAVVLKAYAEKRQAVEPHYTSIELPSNLLNADDILKKAKTLQRICAVYFLIQDAEIVYVGYSTDLTARLASHAKSKKFDSYAHIACSMENAIWLEKLYIAKFKPRLNVVVPWYIAKSEAYESLIEAINAANN